MSEINVAKVTLGTGKVVYIRESKLKDQEVAIKTVGNRAGENKRLWDFYVNQELMKLLIVRVGEEDYDGKKQVNLETAFTKKELVQVGQAISEIEGGGDESPFSLTYDGNSGNE